MLAAANHSTALAALVAVVTGAVAGGAMAFALVPGLSGPAVRLWQDYVAEGFRQTLTTFFFC